MAMQGRIIKGIAGFYYVQGSEEAVYECKAKGIFRKDGQKPLVGDYVMLEILDKEKKIGSITELLPRKKELLRPAVANVDQTLLVFAAATPEPNFNLLDRLLISMEYQQVPVALCFNKCELISQEKRREYQERFMGTGYPLFFISVKEKLGIREIQDFLKGKTTAVAGPSGVGKSSLTNILQSAVEMETGLLSEKIDRGKHTTRHSQLIYLDTDTYLMDTPGFSSLYVNEILPEDLWQYYPDFVPWEPECRFGGCLHLKEADCGVKKALEEGKISPGRYETYQALYEELEQVKRY